MGRAGPCERARSRNTGLVNTHDSHVNGMPTTVSSSPECIRTCFQDPIVIKTIQVLYSLETPTNIVNLGIKGFVTLTAVMGETGALVGATLRNPGKHKPGRHASQGPAVCPTPILQRQRRRRAPSRRPPPCLSPPPHPIHRRGGTSRRPTCCPEPVPPALFAVCCSPAARLPRPNPSPPTPPTAASPQWRSRAGAAAAS